jgi:hypothetical protein
MTRRDLLKLLQLLLAPAVAGPGGVDDERAWTMKVTRELRAWILGEPARACWLDDFCGALHRQRARCLDELERATAEDLRRWVREARAALGLPVPESHVELTDDEKEQIHKQIRDHVWRQEWAQNPLSRLTADERQQLLEQIHDTARKTEGAGTRRTADRAMRPHAIPADAVSESASGRLSVDAFAAAFPGDRYPSAVTADGRTFYFRAEVAGPGRETTGWLYGAGADTLIVLNDWKEGEALIANIDVWS